MGLVIEPGHIVVGLRHEPGLGEPLACAGVKERQAATMHEVMDEGGDEDRLAGARKAGHAEPHVWRAASDRSIEHVVEDDPHLVGNGREGRQDVLPGPMWTGEAASNDRHRFGFLKRERQNAGNEACLSWSLGAAETFCRRHLGSQKLLVADVH